MKRLLIICPSRIRPDRIQEMLKSFDETKSEGTDMVIYIADDDPRIEEYKVTLLGRNYEIGPRIPVCHVYNHMVRKYPDYGYYGEVCDDHVYRTPGWDNALVGEIENHGGWGVAFGWGMIHPKEGRLPQAMIMSGNLVRALGYMVEPSITHAYTDRFTQDLMEELGILFPCPDIVIEHKHVLNGKAEMDDNYRWVLSGETLAIGKAQYEEWRANKMQSDIEKLKRRMAVKIGVLIKCYHNTDYLRAVLKAYSWTDRIILQNYRFPSVPETTDDTEEISLAMRLRNLKFFKGTENILQQHELTNRAIEELNDLDLLFFADADELIGRFDQEKIIGGVLESGVNIGYAHIRDYVLDFNHQLPPRDREYKNNWCMVLFRPSATRFVRLRQHLPSTSRFFDDVTMHHFGFVFPEDRLNWKINWEAQEEKIAVDKIKRAIEARVPCEPPPGEILQLIGEP